MSIRNEYIWYNSKGQGHQSDAILLLWVLYISTLMGNKLELSFQLKYYKLRRQLFNMYYVVYILFHVSYSRLSARSFEFQLQ